MAPAIIAQSQVATVPVNMADTAKVAKSLVRLGAIAPKAPIWIPIIEVRKDRSYRWMQSWQNHREQMPLNLGYGWKDRQSWTTCHRQQIR
jgi:hypothetical protein